jgi:GNAT superfamily N-acetyltransferase
MVREIVPPDTAVAFPAMRALRPHYDDQAAWVRQVVGVQRTEGYRLVGAFEEGEDAAVAVAGFRVGHNLAWGRYLYIDDLSTLPTGRRRGHARRLLAWLEEEARRLHCDELHLDSGVGPERADAHRLYFASGMRITSYHFTRELI